jgi:hypothetical protein
MNKIETNTALKFATKNGWSDVDPYEVVRVVSEKTIEVRAMNAKLLNGSGSGESDALKFFPGGFCGHTSGEQRYEFSSNPEAAVIRIRLGKRGWKDANGNRFSLTAEPFKHYDFNF